MLMLDLPVIIWSDKGDLRLVPITLQTIFACNRTHP